MTVLGIDIGKDEFHCALLEGDRAQSHSFPNKAKGFDQLRAWLRNRKVGKVHTCMEATGGFSDALAEYLHDHGHVVSVVNPLAIKLFGQSELSRTKTDKADAALIARYAVAHRPQPWTPPSPSERRLRQLVRRRQALESMRMQEKNRLQAPGNENVRTSIKGTIGFIVRQLHQIEREIERTIDDDPDLRAKRDLAKSIPGVGKHTAAAILGELPNITEFRSSKALTAFAGLCPHIRQSGSSVFSSHLTAIGSRSIRGLLFMPALVAMRWNPLLRAYAQRLRDRGKHAMQIIVAVMRKLLVIIYGVLRSSRPFDVATA